MQTHPDARHPSSSRVEMTIAADPCTWPSPPTRRYTKFRPALACHTFNHDNAPATSAQRHRATQGIA